MSTTDNSIASGCEQIQSAHPLVHSNFSVLPDQFCGTDQHTAFENYAAAITQFLRNYTWLFDCHVVNFFKSEIWESSVPEEWRSCLASASLDDLIRIPMGFYKEHWDDSLKRFIREAKSLDLKRDTHAMVSALYIKDDAERDSEKQNSHRNVLEAVMTVGMKSKKQHEVPILANLINRVTKSCNSTIAVDIGSGQGYLTQWLGFRYHLNVVGIDNNQLQTDGALRRTQEITQVSTLRQSKKQQKSSKQIKDSSVANNSDNTTTTTTNTPLQAYVKAITSHLSLDIDLTEFFRLLSPFTPALATNNNSDSATQNIVLVGLHTCGDLAATMLRVFKQGDQHIAGLVNVGCCYHKLTEEGAQDHDDDDNDTESGKGGCSSCTRDHGYPLSAFLASPKHRIVLGKGARMLACQAVARWNEDPEESRYQFKVHTYRAATEALFAKAVSFGCDDNNNTSNSNTAAAKSFTVGHVPKGKCKAFSTYVLHALAKMSKTANPSNNNNNNLQQAVSMYLSSLYPSSSSHTDLPALLDAYYEDHYVQTGRTHTVSCFWSLRAVLAPVIESLVLVDRLLYLLENNNNDGGDQVQAHLVSLFDPVVSPRGVALVAMKKKNNNNNNNNNRNDTTDFDAILFGR